MGGPRDEGLEEGCAVVPFGLSTLGEETGEGEVGDLRGLPSLGESMAAGKCDICCRFTEPAWCFVRVS